MFLLIGSQTWDWPDKWRLSSCCFTKAPDMEALALGTTSSCQCSNKQATTEIYPADFKVWWGSFFRPLPFQGLQWHGSAFPQKHFRTGWYSQKIDNIIYPFEGAWSKEMGPKPLVIVILLWHDMRKIPLTTIMITCTSVYAYNMMPNTIHIYIHI